MKKKYWAMLSLMAGLAFLSSCDSRSSHSKEEYLEVIGEYEGTMPEGGFRLNLSFNGPLDMRNKFQVWADSMQQITPGLMKINDNIYLNHMPEQTGRNFNRSHYQVGVTYSLQVPDSVMYNRVTEDLFRRNLPFQLNVAGSILTSERKTALQQELMEKALANARKKLDFLSSGSNRSYEIVGIEELDQNAQFGPEYYEYNRRVISRLKVKARLIEGE